MIKGKRKRNWQECVGPYLLSTPIVTLTPEEVKKVNDFCEEMREKKLEEVLYQKDNGSMVSRFSTGFTGEFAANKFLGLDTMSFEIGLSKKFDKADLGGLECGVKTCEVDKFHVVHKKPLRPELIVVRMDEFTFRILGYASIQVLKDYQDDSLILSPKLQAKGSKTGFYGYEHVIPIFNLQELEKLCKT